MNNTVILCGRLVNDIIIDDEASVLRFKISINTNNINEKFDQEKSNIIPIEFKIFDEKAKDIPDMCKKGCILGIKGRIQMDGTAIKIVAEKFSFLSSKKEKEDK